MTNQEILTKAIEKAIAGGWKPTMFSWIPEDYKALLDYWSTADNYKSVIFNHDFAKALWGEDTNRLWKCPACGYKYYEHNEIQEYCPNDGRKVQDVTEPKPIWEQTYAEYLQQMVIAEDPIKYLGENI